MTIAQLQAALDRHEPRQTPPPARPRTEPNAAAIRPAQAPSSAPPPLASLPWRYDVTEVVAMPVDPLLIHVYWELRATDVARVRDELDGGWDGSQQVLRAYEVTGVAEGDGDGAWLVAHARHQFDFDVGGDVGSHYVHLWSPEQTLIFEVGWRSRSGRFVAVARSNVVTTPRNASCGGPERWMTVRRGRIVATSPDAIPNGDSMPIGPEPYEPAPWSATFPAHRGWGGRR